MQINALNLVGKIGLPSSFGENGADQRENAETLRLTTLKVDKKALFLRGFIPIPMHGDSISGFPDAVEM